MTVRVLDQWIHPIRCGCGALLGYETSDVRDDPVPPHLEVSGRSLPRPWRWIACPACNRVVVVQIVRSSPLGRRMLAELARGPLTTAELAERLGVSIDRASHQLGQLRDKGQVIAAGEKEMPRRTPGPRRRALWQAAIPARGVA